MADTRQLLIHLHTDITKRDVNTALCRYGGAILAMSISNAMSSAYQDFRNMRLLVK